MYYSQYGQDYFLDKVVFNKKKRGFFLDIGAHDGISFSNTYFFEKNRNYDGFCFEPNPVVFEQLVKNRRCIKMNVCVGAENESMEFTKITGYGEMLSGLTGSYDERHLERIEEALSVHGGTKETIIVRSVDINRINELQGRAIDYCNIDTEGNEINILQSIDFKKLTINVFTIENNYDSDEQRRILIDNGYVLFYTIGDEIFIKKELVSNAMKVKKMFFRLSVALRSYSKRIIAKGKRFFHA